MYEYEAVMYKCTHRDESLIDGKQTLHLLQRFAIYDTVLQIYTCYIQMKYIKIKYKFTIKIDT